ncbi:MAG: OmpA family protein [Balneolaceae bacterium]
MKSLNSILIISLFAGLMLIQFGCASQEPVTEPVVEEPEPEPEPIEEVEDDFTEVVEEEPEEPETIESLNTVHFGFDLFNITDRAAMLLAENIEQLRDAPEVRVRIDAFTDHIGGDQYNLRLSVRRATAVQGFYRSNGISENRIETRGLGKAPVPCTEAQRDRDTPGCEMNRRAESHPINPSSY